MAVFKTEVAYFVLNKGGVHYRSETGNSFHFSFMEVFTRSGTGNSFHFSFMDVFTRLEAEAEVHFDKRPLVTCLK
jgi:hypothetical protein